MSIDDFLTRIRDIASTLRITPTWGVAGMWVDLVVPFLKSAENSPDAAIQQHLATLKKTLESCRDWQPLLDWVFAFESPQPA